LPPLAFEGVPEAALLPLGLAVLVGGLLVLVEPEGMLPAGAGLAARLLDAGLVLDDVPFGSAPAGADELPLAGAALPDEALAPPEGSSPTMDPPFAQTSTPAPVPTVHPLGQVIVAIVPPPPHV
jgi:hypothetical protein